MSKLFKAKATLQRIMSIHWKIYHFLQPNFVKIEMLLDICFICIFLTNWFDSILLRSKDLEEIPGLITNVIHWNSQSLRTKYIYASVYFYDVFSTLCSPGSNKHSDRGSVEIRTEIEE